MNLSSLGPCLCLICCTCGEPLIQARFSKWDSYDTGACRYYTTKKRPPEMALFSSQKRQKRGTDHFGQVHLIGSQLGLNPNEEKEEKQKKQ